MRQIVSIGATLLASAVVVSASVSKGEQDRIREAAAVLEEIHRAPDRDIPSDLWEKATCVAVVPSVKKAAFIVGGEYGKGLISCRGGSSWSAPSFLTIGKGSVGFQLGAESVDLVMLIMNQRGVNRLLEDKVVLGGEASVAAGPVGRDARAMTDAQMKAEVLSYSRSQGLFAGIELSGGVLKPDNEDNHDLYGAGITPRDILVAKRVSPPAAAARFMAALRRTIPPKESGHP
jgi:lipid-binding SYLF domain-containing protein